ncbi:DsbA family oxidoreductase [Diaphorobacter caeni]|uniref:DsbA family oxidoreductase n=1 Tax=Diaphorobacter caeni TaxID=2784387 RepID=UPI00188EE201|nr:DsbA family protein [Diaphorobacter caeni]MBF5005895.1 DsbA family protein [Diaphorobacter caeni]
MSTDTTLDRAPALRVDYALDLICPWCWIGLRHLRAALRGLLAHDPGIALQLRWHASTLLPHIPTEGVAYQAFYEARLGSREAVLARRAQVQAHARPVGITLAFDAIERFPNSALACALVNVAQEQLGLIAMCDFVESLYDAYFVQGRDIGQARVLLELAGAAGVACSPEQLMEAGLRSCGLSSQGVPHYVFNERVQITGAVPAEQLLAAMAQALPHGVSA